LPEDTPGFTLIPELPAVPRPRKDEVCARRQSLAQRALRPSICIWCTKPSKRCGEIEPTRPISV